MTPEPQNFYDPFALEYLVDKAMLNVDTSRVGPVQIADQLLVGWGISKRILCENG